MNGHFKYPTNPKHAPSKLKIMSTRSNDRNGINC